MVRRAEPSTPPPIPDDATTCECGCMISARHMARHLRSKRHREELEWYRGALLRLVAAERIAERDRASTVAAAQNGIDAAATAQ